MRNTCIVLRLVLVWSLSMLTAGMVAQPVNSLPPSVDPKSNDIPLSWQLIEREFHFERWEATVALPVPDGRRAAAQKHSFTTIGTGLNYRDEKGEWQRTREEFELTADGFAIARRGPHQLIVGNNANDWAVDFLTSEGTRLRSGPVAFGYFDPVSGQQVILGTVRDSAGQLTAPNEVLFKSCFDGLDASVRITYRMAGMSSDLILHELPPDPVLLGLSPESRLEMYTEFHPDTPPPTQTQQVLRAEPDPQRRAQMVEPDLIDHVVEFGGYKMGRGSAFAQSRAGILPAPSDRIPVAKRFIFTPDGRRILIESIEHGDAKNLLPPCHR